MTKEHQFQRALSAADQLEKSSISSGVLHLHTVKPIDKDALLESTARAKVVVTVEEHVLHGGLGSGVLEVVCDAGLDRIPKFIRLGIPNSFPERYGTQDDLLSDWKLDSESIANVVREVFFG